MKTCKQCSQSFSVTDADWRFYEKASPVIGGKTFLIPEPSLCPDCRQQRRLAIRNEGYLYHRKSDFSGKPMVSLYSPDKKFKIYNQEEWWSDKWDPLEYGRGFDFGRPFFEQFRELQRVVPRYNNLTLNCENCEYDPWAIDSRNCYLSRGGRYNEDCYYCLFPTQSTHCIDCALPTRSQFCYECVDVLSCYECFYSIYLENCHRCTFCYDLIGCRDCFECTGLRNKQYHILNKPYSKEEYAERIKQFHLSNQTHFLEAKKRFEELRLNAIHRDMRIVNSENCRGDWIKKSRNVQMSYDVEDTEDGKFLYDIRGAKDCYDVYVGGYNCELCYEDLSSVTATRVTFSVFCWDGCHDIYYSDSCFASGHLFGCIGLRHKEYCLLNKQYSKEEYQALVPKIIEHMKKTGATRLGRGQEWGEFFPIASSPFAYNETVAQEYFPLDEREAKKRGWPWKKEEVVKKIKGPAYKIPDDIADVSDDILKAALICEVTGKPYKIIPQELKFYRQYQIPVPRRCPDERHKERLALRNPRHLWPRTCANCGKAIQTTYSPDRPEKVYCEQCYLKEVY